MASENVQYCQNGNVDIAYTKYGEGPAIILMHGISANREVWQPVVDQLSSRATVISVDQRGHGLSGKPKGGYDADAICNDIRELVKSLTRSPVMLVGHSMGARNAWVYASKHPEDVCAVVAVDYCPSIEGADLDILEERVRGGDRTFSSVIEIEQYLQKRYPRMPLDAVKRRAIYGYHLVDGEYRPLASPNALAQTVEGLRTDYRDEFVQVKVPMTMIRGAESKMVRESVWERAKTLRPDFRWVVVPNADHYVPEERPDVVVAEIERLLPGGGDGGSQNPISHISASS